MLDTCALAHVWPEKVKGSSPGLPNIIRIELVTIDVESAEWLLVVVASFSLLRPLNLIVLLCCKEPTVCMLFL